MIETSREKDIYALQTPLKDFNYMVTHTDAEDYYGVFPAHVKYDERNNVYDVHQNDRTIQSLCEAYSSDLLTSDAVESLYVGVSLIDCFGVQAIKNRRQVQEDLWQIMSSPDSLNSQLLDIEENTKFQLSLFNYLSQELSPHIPRINGLRFAVSILKKSQSNIFQNLSDEMYRTLRIRMTGQEQQFVKIARVFTRGLDEARAAFAETIPLIEIAAAFPMDDLQTERVIELFKSAA